MSEFAQAVAATQTPFKISYSMNEAAEATGISRTSLYDDIAAGKLEARKRGSGTYILAAELLRYLQAFPAAVMAR
jgi:excisionase family DNA binding protein